MTLEKALRISVSLAVLAAASASGTTSTAIVVDVSPQSAHWVTVFTNTVPLTWDWSANTTRADLGITGMNASYALSFMTATSNYLWQVFPSDVPMSEDMYTLTLTLYTNGMTVAEVLTSRLAVMTGAFGATKINVDNNSPAWSKVKGNVVIPYDASFADASTNAGVSQLVIASGNGRVQTNAFTDVVGYTGWDVVNGGWGYDTFDLTLTFFGLNEATLSAELMRPVVGTLLKMR